MKYNEQQQYQHKRSKENHLSVHRKVNDKKNEENDTLKMKKRKSTHKIKTSQTTSIHSLH